MSQYMALEDYKGKKSRDLIAKQTGVSTGQLAKEKKIVQVVKQKPELKHIIGKLDSGEISVNEADEKIKDYEDFDAEEKKRIKWRKLREEVSIYN